MADPKIKNMEQFATVSGISRPTLSKYFNDPGSVRKSSRSRIEAALERYDYRPNIYAMNQNRRLTKNIGIMVPYLADPFFAEIARNIEALVRGGGYRPVLLGAHGDPAQEIGNLETLRAIKPAGVLMAPLGRISDPEAIRAFAEDVPTVLFDNQIADIGAAYVGHDNAQATKMMCDYLCRTGEPPVFFEMRTPSNPNAFRRRNTYCEVMEALGHKPHLVQVDGEGWDFESIGFRGCKYVIENELLPTNTVLCSNDRLAIGFLSAAYEMGLRVGNSRGCDLRVAGHDNHPYSRYTCPTLTTISQDYGAIARTSAEALIGLIESDSPNEARNVTLFDGNLLMRGSA
ncbi:LacI family DNA-binding transcriptional regulator [Pelagimonas varians]|uniref:LacI family DNA-binding transcriptional regulator n=1 Tax=Pelagimonas varians TaxID=696760 RepID=UPI000BEF1149|nr:LacI family DNA-binding transcriptional regulator [Pelagimonas varians]